MDGLNMGIIRQVPIRLPPLSAQKLFRERLFAIEALRRNHATSATELGNLFASLQQRAFRGEL
jgi:type I restriction enzyme S subunit